MRRSVTTKNLFCFVSYLEMCRKVCLRNSLQQKQLVSKVKERGNKPDPLLYLAEFPLSVCMCICETTRIHTIYFTCKAHCILFTKGATPIFFFFNIQYLVFSIRYYSCLHIGTFRPSYCSY